MKMNQIMLERLNRYWIVPVTNQINETAIDTIRRLVESKKVFGFSSGVHRRTIDVGDWLCFYAKGVGVVGYARVLTPIRKDASVISARYPWVFDLTDVNLDFEEPVIITNELRNKLDAYTNKPNKGSPIWSWFVQSTHTINEHDFNILTGRRPEDLKNFLHPSNGNTEKKEINPSER
jgi:hypothetical protein